ncbi:MAG: hypothetical protein ACYSU6_09425, partial [Planctomycetota bacterium]
HRKVHSRIFVFCVGADGKANGYNLTICIASPGLLAVGAIPIEPSNEKKHFKENQISRSELSQFICLAFGY